MNEINLNWFVIQTKPSSEWEVKTRLSRAGIEVFYPRIKSIVRSRGKPQERHKSLFPSYVFARFDSSIAETVHMLKYTRGVNKILGVGSNLIPVPDDMIHIIMERVNKDDVIEQRLVFKKGDNIRFRKGPFSDLVGILEKPVAANGRVRVLLEIMNKVVKTEISCSDIERISL